MIVQKLIVRLTFLIISIFCLLLISCDSVRQSEKLNNEFRVQIEELTDNQYPDNPDRSIQHSLTGAFSHSEVVIDRIGDSFNLIFLPKNTQSDSLILSNVNLMEFMPTVPVHVRNDEYLTEITLVNQEWNRQQVKFSLGDFSFKGTNQESSITRRVDLARNCLNSYLWEVITYANQDSTLAPVYHGWFNFPQELYQSMFKERNDLEFKQFASKLEDWVTPEAKKIDFDILRTIVSDTVIAFESKNKSLYPIVGERKKKEINIIKPLHYSIIQDFLTNTTLFATFTPPGYYNTSEPRKTKLGALAQLKRVVQSDIISQNHLKDSLIELRFSFLSNSGNIKTDVVIGGVNLEDIPTLPFKESYKGYQMPMGISNHSFYETYEECLKKTSFDNPYYSLIVDSNGLFLDSHDIGIDGSLLHFDSQDAKKLHVWLLSFERHAFVGHYVLKLK